MTGKSRPQILKGSARDDERGMQEEEKGEAAARESLIIFTFTSSDLALSHSLFFFFAVIFLSLLLRFVVFLSLSFLPAPVTYISFLPLHHPLFTFFFLLSTIYPPHPCFFLISSFLFFCLFLPSPLLHLLSSLSTPSICSALLPLFFVRLPPALFFPHLSSHARLCLNPIFFFPFRSYFHLPSHLPFLVLSPLFAYSMSLPPLLYSPHIHMSSRYSSPLLLLLLPGISGVEQFSISSEISSSPSLKTWQERTHTHTHSRQC